jgi:hypothetical protein
MDSHGNIIEPPTADEKFAGTVYSFIYSMVVIIFGTAYK